MGMLKAVERSQAYYLAQHQALYVCVLEALLESCSGLLPRGFLEKSVDMMYLCCLCMLYPSRG